VAPFIGFAGLEVPQFTAHSTPCVEIGWRLAFEYWGRGYATEAAQLALAHGFRTLSLPEIVSFTTVSNRRSRAVMERLGMHRDAGDELRLPAAPGRPSAAAACALPDRFRFVFRQALTANPLLRSPKLL